MANGRGYDRDFRYGRAPGYDRGFRGTAPRARYDRSYKAGPAPRPGSGAEFAPPIPFPFAPFGWDPMMGPMAWPMADPFGMAATPGYDRGFRTPPRQSPAYGRGGDRALRAWADRYGYDVEFSIPPRRPRR